MTPSPSPSEPPDDDCGCESGSDSADAPSGEKADSQSTVKFSVPEMDCPSCAGKVEASIEELDGISNIDTRPTTAKVSVTAADSTTGETEIVRAIESAGYEVTGTSGEYDAGDTDGADSILRTARAIKTGISGVFVALGLLFRFGLPGYNTKLVTVLGSELHVSSLLFLVAIAVGGEAILRNGYYSAINRQLDIDFLMSTAILGALAASLVFGEDLYFEAATLAFLFSVAELLERYSMDQARNSLRELMDLSPDEATVKRDGDEETIPVEDVEIGDIVVVKPGEQIPMDGEVVDGQSAVNQAPITGESVPVDKTVGDEVFAGTINEEGYLELQVTARAADNTLSQIVEMVENAQSNKTDREQFVERFAAYYTPTIVSFAILTTLGGPFVLGISWSTSVLNGLTLLVLACPCAFVISTPVSVVSGITSAAKNGVLIKGGKHLEAMGAVDVVALDKTGTLTKGELTVTDVVGLNGNTRADVLRYARGLEERSEHPIADAIVAQAATEGLTTPPVDEFESITGKGVEATLDGETHYAGKPGLFEELGFDLSHVHATTDGGVVTEPAEGSAGTETAQKRCEQDNCLNLLEETVPALQSAGKTVVIVGTEDEIVGIIGVADEIRPEAAATISRLKSLGIERTVMLTGDNERTAAAIAREVGIDEHQAELLPEEKVDQIERLLDEHGTVAMVGDGINDAPALATATIGIAMGAAGTDTALETADIALMSDDLWKLPYLYELAGDANDVIRQNIWSSLVVKAGLSIAVPFAYIPIWFAVLAGDAGMTTAVTGNAMRLSRIKPPARESSDSFS